jgi:hypothetical protein
MNRLSSEDLSTLTSRALSQRMAGYDYEGVLNAMHCITTCAQGLHEYGLIHGDIKQR